MWKILTEHDGPNYTKGYNLFHIHNKVHIAVDSSRCKLCKLMVPEHIKIQLKLLGLTYLDVENLESPFIDFFTSDSIKNNWGFLQIKTKEIHISDKETDIKSIKRLFNSFNFHFKLINHI